MDEARATSFGSDPYDFFLQPGPYSTTFDMTRTQSGTICCHNQLS